MFSTSIILTSEFCSSLFYKLPILHYSFEEVGSRWNLRTPAPCPFAIYVSLIFLKDCSALLPRATILLNRLFCLIRIHTGKGQRSTSLSFPAPDIRVEYVPTFPFLHHVAHMRESLPSSACAPYNVDWYVRLGALLNSAVFPVRFIYKMKVSIDWFLPKQLAGIVGNFLGN